MKIKQRKRTVVVEKFA